MPRLSAKPLLPYLALLAGILAITVSPFFARVSQASGPVFAFYRMATGAIILTPFFLREQGRARLTPRISRTWLLLPILGGLVNAGDLLLWYASIQSTRLANATLLNNIAPVWVALFAWLILKEKLRGFFWIGLLAALAGAAIVLGADFVNHPSLNRGNLLGLTSSLFYATYYLVTQRGRRRLSALHYTYIMTLSSGSANLLIALLSGAPIFGYNGATYLAFLGAGVLTQAIGFLALSFALGRISAPLVSATMIVQPVLSAVLAIPILGETLSSGQWIGGLAALGGIYLVNRSQEASAGPDQLPAPGAG